MLLKGSRSHPFSISLCTSFWLVMHGIYCKGIAPNMISCLSVTTYFYDYLAGDLIWTVLLGESDSTPITWLHQKLPTTTPILRECSPTLTTTTTRRIQLQHVGFINNRRRLLAFVKIARQHAGNYFEYSFCLQVSRKQLWLGTCWRLHRLLVSPTKLVGIDSD
jgi:hypothetical protein